MGVELGLMVRKQAGIKNEGIYFKGIHRNSAGTQKQIYLCTYGKGIGELALKAARQKWGELRAWAKTHGKDPAGKMKGDESPEPSTKHLMDRDSCMR